MTDSEPFFVAQVSAQACRAPGKERRQGRARAEEEEGLKQFTQVSFLCTWLVEDRARCVAEPGLDEMCKRAEVDLAVRSTEAQQ